MPIRAGRRADVKNSFRLKGVMLACAAAVSWAHSDDWRGKAVELYPDLGIADSAFRKEFERLRRERKSSTPSLFKNPQWPVVLAKQCASKLASTTNAAPAAAPTPPPSPEMTADEKLYVAKCGKCHDTFYPGVEEMTWNRWIWKWKDRARLTDEEYDQLMAYARTAREARQAKMAAAAASRTVPRSEEDSGTARLSPGR